MKNSGLLTSLRDSGVIVVRGYGIIGEYIYGIIKNKYPDRDVYVYDRDSNKKDYFFISFERLLNIKDDCSIVIASYYNRKIMEQELLDAGFPPGNILYGVTDEAWDTYLQRLSDVKLTPLTQLQFEIDISSHCNLDCNCCSQFGAIAEPEFVDAARMERDFKRLGFLFGGKAKRIYLIGGEPLLNRNINCCIEIARNAFHDAKIDVFSNGILLPGMKREFWETCRGNDVGLIVTKYPIKIDYDRMKKHAESNGVRFEFFGTSGDFKYMTPLGLDLDGGQDMHESFILCPEANNCIKLKNGRLYTCTRPAAIEKFNRYFNKELKVSKEDGINIYEAENGKAILDFLCRPIPFCRYCDNKTHREAREWCHSGKKIEEWT
jgi:hypothetical protein